MGGFVIDNFLDGVAHRAHGYNNVLGLGGAVVVEQLVVRANLGVDLVHILLYNRGNRVIIGVTGFSGLEIDVRVLGCAPQNGMLRVQSPGAEFADSVHVHHFFQVFIIPLGHFLDFVGGAEAVEGHAALDGGQMSYGAQVHDFLRIGAGQHSEAGLTAGHNVLMVAENGQSVGSQSAGGAMNDARQQLAGDLVHIGDHQQQALRSGVGGGQRAGRQGAVNSAGGAGLGLHLNNAHFLPEDVFLTIGGPLVGQVSHNGRGSDGVNRRHVCKRIRDVSRGGITVHGFHFSSHGGSPPSKIYKGT